MRFFSAITSRIPDKKRFTVYVIGLAFVIVSVWLVHTHQPSTSDDVAIQTVFLHHINLDGEGLAWLGEDNYMLKVPFYLALSELFDNSRNVLLFTSIVFNVLGFGMFFYASFYFYRKFRVKDGLLHLSLLWLASICVFYTMMIMINPNQRNLEIGLFFLILALLARYIDQEFSFAGRPKKALVVSLAALFGLLLYSDPFFVFMLVGPLLLLFAGYLYFKEFEPRMFRAILFLLASLVISLAWKLFFEQLDIITRKPDTSLILLDQLGQNIVKAIRAYFFFFSAHFWGEKVVRPSTIRLVLNALIMGAFVIAPAILLHSRRKIGKGKNIDPWLVFWLLQPLYITLVYIMSSNTVANGDGSFRFLVLVPFFAPLTLALLIRSLQPRLKALAVLVLAVAFLLNAGEVAQTVVQNIRTPAPDPNHLQWATIRVAKEQGVRKGFGQYWDSTINTYLSRDRVIVVPTSCVDIQHFLMHDKILRIPARKSFYIYNPVWMQNCSQDKLAATLGKPAAIVPIEGDIKMNVYDYDITKTLRAGYYYQ